MPLQPRRTVDALRELQALTGDERGAQRVAWTDTWEQAREWLRAQVAGSGAEETVDAAGNQWFTLAGASPGAVLIGGHIDSVPNGGWLDGALNVVAGLEVLRRIAEEGTPPVTVRLVNWADEEGARFGRSLFGSSAAAGSMADQDELRARKDADGTALPDALREHGVELDSALDASSELETPSRTSSCTSSRGLSSNRSTSPSASCSGRSASSGTRSRFAARPPMPGRRRWTSDAMHSRARRDSS